MTPRRSWLNVLRQHHGPSLLVSSIDALMSLAHVHIELWREHVTNTPSLAATQQVLAKIGFSHEALALPALGYAVAYPFGILGILIVMWLLRVVVEREARTFEVERERSSPRVHATVCHRGSPRAGPARDPQPRSPVLCHKRVRSSGTASNGGIAAADSSAQVPIHTQRAFSSA